MKTRLSILIPTVEGRESMLSALIAQVESLGNGYPYEIVIDKDKKGQASIGTKRNRLRLKAKGDYIVFVDDDDMISDPYFKEAFEGVDSGVDVVGLVGIMTTNGRNQKRFEHSLEHTSYYQRNGVYYRPPNHLNVMLKDKAMRIDFPEISMGEDTNFAMKLSQSRLLSVEHHVNFPTYHYNFVNSKKY